MQSQHLADSRICIHFNLYEHVLLTYMYTDIQLRLFIYKHPYTYTPVYACIHTCVHRVVLLYSDAMSQ